MYPYETWTLEKLVMHREWVQDGLEWAQWCEASNYAVEYSSEYLAAQLAAIDAAISAKG